MSGRVAEGHLQVLQIYRLLQCVHEGDKAHIEKMVNLGVKNLINLTEPHEGTGALHVAVSANNQGDVPLLYSVTFSAGSGKYKSFQILHLSNSINTTLKKYSHTS